MSTYFPIFRGKQFDLIAVREFAESMPGNERIHPVIEPVRDPTENTGLIRMMAALEAGGLNYTIIVNPANGDLVGDHEATEKILWALGNAEATSENLALGILFHAGGDSDKTISLIRESSFADFDLTLVYDKPAVGPADVGELAGADVTRHIVPDKNAVRILGNVFDAPTFAHLELTFTRKNSNSEYENEPPSVFCSSHLYLEDDGYEGLADYLTIGDEYSETGALPRVLVIHLTYRDPANKLIYIRHFHSETNRDQSDPGGKFREAVAALVDFVDQAGLNNPAIESFRTYHVEQRFPGLGMIKKLSMQNHLYVMDEALREE